MVTTRIYIKPHLKEYLSGKFNQHQDHPVRFPDNMDIYHQIFNLTEKRPAKCPVDSGNLEIVLPERRSFKRAKTYNYLGARSQREIRRTINEMFWVDFRNYTEKHRYKNGSHYISIAIEFLRVYGISSISEDALIKHYYRWRKRDKNIVNKC